MMYRLSQFLTLMVFLVGAHDALGDVYRVSELEGNVRYWDTFAARWRSLTTGDEIRPGALVQFTQNTKLRVDGVNRAGMRQVLKPLVVEAQSATITRLEADSIRNVELGGYFLNLADDSTSKMFSSGSSDQTMMASIDRAWDRVVALFETATTEENATAADEKPLASRESKGSDPDHVEGAKEIKIIYPPSGTSLLVGQLPTDLMVTWRRPKTSSAFKVLVWEDAKGAPEPIGVTTDPRYRFRVVNSGRYYTRIESVDGKWRSKSHLFIVSTLNDELQFQSKRE